MKLKCKEVSRLLSEALDQRLPWHQQMRLRYHLMICKDCKQVSAQFATLRLVGQRFRQNIKSGQQDRL
ncbi:MAG: zf-HC2 domain-containing protein [Rhodocyclaceae bacterium]|nr:zf-HC2 domain-containing protein [Rhodocyclaceae bacterium]MBK9624774.1 zf-HC2 domain-containing protein [Rhodocyclaceae bacterium]MBL0077134.1 zf-HC2 domain-containing protein [Rhodocyclaceae bacterium]MBP6110733.1 zf-HC2 domain-containing protein [Rhodocyclaceae bacterium]MBP6280197.1 zf-HC2 domain-containing protein [Rhodocyclaceae bacterium]